MKLYFIRQDTNLTYNAYRSAVVAASTPTAARMMHPDGSTICDKGCDPNATWVDNPALVTVTEIGTANPDIKVGVICADFNGEREECAL